MISLLVNIDAIDLQSLETELQHLAKCVKNQAGVNFENLTALGRETGVARTCGVVRVSSFPPIEV